jgi:hypothetical protein
MRCASRRSSCDETPRVEIGGIFGDHTDMAGDNMPINIARILLLCAVAALSACHKDSAADQAAQAVAQPRAKAPVAPRKGPTVAELTAGMVEAAPQGKSQAPVALKFELGRHPKVGLPLEIDLALIAQVDAGPVTMKVSSADPLTLAADSNEFDFPELTAGEVYKSKLNVTPTGEGVLLIGVTISVKHDEVTDVKAFSIPIIADR